MNEKNRSNLDDLADKKKGDRYTLECGHNGRIVWVSSDRGMLCVRGENRRCQLCGKKSSSGWVPTYHLIPIDEIKKRAI